MQHASHAHVLDASAARAGIHEHVLPSGERRLMLAVLEDALRTVLNARRGRTSTEWLQRELAWFRSNDRSHPFAFEVICDVLDLDANWLRRRLRTHSLGCQPSSSVAAIAEAAATDAS